VKSVLNDADAIILATNHAAYLGLDLEEIAKLERPPILVDCWGVWDEERARATGVELITFGKGNNV